MFSLTVVAMTGKRFSGFAPYVASVNDAGLVAFQAALRGGGSAVFAGDGGEVEELVSRSIHAGVTSHPDLNNARDASFYGEQTCRFRQRRSSAECGRSTRSRSYCGGPMSGW